MKILATFENGNQQYVVRVLRDEDGKVANATTMYYPKEIDATVEELSELFPTVIFTEVE